MRRDVLQPWSWLQGYPRGLSWPQLLLFLRRLLVCLSARKAPWIHLALRVWPLVACLAPPPRGWGRGPDLGLPGGSSCSAPGEGPACRPCLPAPHCTQPTQAHGMSHLHLQLTPPVTRRALSCPALCSPGPLVLCGPSALSPVISQASTWLCSQAPSYTPSGSTRLPQTLGLRVAPGGTHACLTPAMRTASELQSQSPPCVRVTCHDLALRGESLPGPSSGLPRSPPDTHHAPKLWACRGLMGGGEQGKCISPAHCHGDNASRRDW